MKLFRRIKARIYTFFGSIPMFWGSRSLFGKFLLVCLGLFLVPLVFIGGVLGFAHVMSALNSNQTYEILYPVEQIASIEIVHVDDSVPLYNHPLDEIPEIVRQHTHSVITLEDAAIAECADDLFALSANRWWNDPSPSIQGGTLLITYQNGSFELICARGTFYYDTGSAEHHLTWYFFDHEEFNSFLQEYGYQPPQ